jgi:hypothetical protein
VLLLMLLLLLLLLQQALCYYVWRYIPLLLLLPLICRLHLLPGVATAQPVHSSTAASKRTRTAWQHAPTAAAAAACTSRCTASAAANIMSRGLLT